MWVVSEAEEDGCHESAWIVAAADWWIDLIRPVWQQHLQNPRRRRPTRLSELERPLIEAPPTAERLMSSFDSEVAL